jgi:type 1 fimbriae regulatory protein FimB
MPRINTIKYLTQDEVRHLFGAITSKRDRALFRVAYYHGLRPSEVGMVQAPHVSLDRARIWVNRLKNGKAGEYPMPPNEVMALKAWMKEHNQFIIWLFYGQHGAPISRRTLHYLMNKYGEKAGIPQDKRHFHVLRHSIATHLMDAGADIRFVQEWLGHRKIENTAVYAQISNPARDKQATRFFSTGMIVGV